MLQRQTPCPARSASGIDATDRQTACPARSASGIDALVALRQLYGLTEEEIGIVEGVNEHVLRSAT